MSDSLSRHAYDILLERILNHHFVPGELINRREIAAQLGMSVAPVLEAMVLLESEGLLESLPRKGTRVSLLRDEDISGNLFVREALECAAARMFCGETIAREGERMRSMARAVDATEPGSLAYFHADCELHRALVDLCRCEVLSREYARINKVSLFYRINKLISARDGDRTPDGHARLIAGLCAAGPEEAQALIHAHIISNKGRFALTRGPEDSP